MLYYCNSFSMFDQRSKGNQFKRKSSENVEIFFDNKKFYFKFYMQKKINLKKKSSQMKNFHETVVIDDNNGKGFCFEMTSFWWINEMYPLIFPS